LVLPPSRSTYVAPSFPNKFGNRGEINAALEHACADALHVREISLPEPIQRRCHLGRRRGVELIEPAAKRRATGGIEIFDYAVSDTGYGNLYVTITQAAVARALPSHGAEAH